MKKLYEFTLYKTEQVEEKVSDKNDKGEEITITKKVDKQIPYKYFFAKPGRVLAEKAEIEYGKVFWQCQKEGILPLSQLQKRFVDDGGVLNQDEVKWREENYEKIWAKQAEYKELTDKISKTGEEEEKVKNLLGEIVALWTNVQEFEENKGGNLYQNTAESVAKNRQSLWWVAHLSYQEIDGKNKPLFGEGDYEEKLKIYDAYNEGDDEFLSNLVKRFFLIGSLWNFGRASSQEEFEISVKTAEAKGIIDAATIIQNIDKKNEERTETSNDPVVSTPAKTESVIVTGAER
jgi:hypothetical protein